VLHATQSGEAGLNELKDKLRGDLVQFAYFVISSKDETDLAGAPKIALITWLGDGARAINKARSGPQRADLVIISQRTATVAAELIASDKVG